MENQGQPLQPGGVERAQGIHVQRLPELMGNGPIRDYRTIQRGPGLVRQLRHGNEPLYCVPMTKCMLIMSIIFTGTILIVLFVLLASEFTNRVEMEFTPRPTDIPKYY